MAKDFNTENEITYVDMGEQTECETESTGIGTGLAMLIGAGVTLAVGGAVKLVKKGIAWAKAKKAEKAEQEAASDHDFVDIDPEEVAQVNAK